MLWWACELSLLTISSIALSGCGTVYNKTSTNGVGGSISLSIATTVVAAGQQIPLSLSATGLSISSVTLSLQCLSNKCGSLDGNTFVAPPAPLNSLQVTITAASAESGVSPASVEITVLPPPSISTMVPAAVVSGSTQTVTIAGSWFVPNSQIIVGGELNGTAATVSSVNVISNTSMTFAITTPPGEAGMLKISVQSSLSTSAVSKPVDLLVSPTGAEANQSLPVFDPAGFFASASSAVYTCTGAAGSYILTCDEPPADFASGEGIRVVSGGGAPRTPAVNGQPTITRQGHQSAGGHTYCYIVFAADPLGGVSAPSPQSCIENEPELSYTGTNNELGGTYAVPEAAFVWYVSMDGGPYRLLTVGGSMDVGQDPGDRGGWPSNLPVGNPNISKDEDLFTSVVSVLGNKIVLEDPLIVPVTQSLVDHDDTDAMQKTINAAAGAGGGIISLGNGTYNVRRPTFYYAANKTTPYYTYTTDYSRGLPWGRFRNLFIPNGAIGNIYIEGHGASTILQTQPDLCCTGSLIGIGEIMNPGGGPYPRIQIAPVDKGATAVTVLGDAAELRTGDDIWLYSGSFNASPCVDSNGTAAYGCHFSELNSVAGVSGNIVTLAYPTSKRYYDDGINSFGMVKLPITPHNIGIEHITINTYNPVIRSGEVFGILVNDIKVNGIPSDGAFMGGYKRDVLIENSSWGLGDWDATWNGTEELDQYTNVAFVNNTITGYAAPGAEGPSMGARIYLTEGTSQAVFAGNVFDHVSIYTQDTTDDIVQQNHFIDGVLTVGDNYTPFPHLLNWGTLQHRSFLSFGGQETAEIGNNIFDIDSDFVPPWIVSLGHFNAGSIHDNVISYGGTHNIAAINSNGGRISNNTVNVFSLVSAIAVIPDEAPSVPPSDFLVQQNVINATSTPAAIYVINAGFNDSAPVCIESNTISIQQGQEQSVPPTAILNCNSVSQ